MTHVNTKNSDYSNSVVYYIYFFEIVFLFFRIQISLEICYYLFRYISSDLIIIFKFFFTPVKIYVNYNYPSSYTIIVYKYFNCNIKESKNF